MPQVGGAKNFNNAAEEARNPNASSHRASPTRTYVMQQLGLKTPGFWADWAQRKINPQAAQPDTADYNPSPSYQPLTNMYQSQTWNAPVNKPARGLDMSDGLRLPATPQGGGGDAYTGRTKKALQDVEKQVTWSQLNAKVGANRFMGDSNLDLINAQQINMDRQMMLYMNDHPAAMLTEAAKDWYTTHNAIPPHEQTNFEAEVSLFSETKKKASKTLYYAAGESKKTIDNVINTAKANGTYNSPIYKSGTSMNITANYGGTKYLSPFG